MTGCSFTGHRKIPSEDEAPLTDLLDRAIAYAYREGCRSFFVGGALGFDTLAAKRLIMFRLSHRDIRITVLVPHRGQEERWSRSERHMYGYILSEADEVEYISEEYSSDCMKKRNLALVLRCDMLIAYLSRENSGAGQTVRMAKREGRTVYNLYSALSSAEK